MERLSAWFEELVFGSSDGGRPNPPVITFIGSGGKTSLIRLLAARLTRDGRKTLVSPTTKMRPFPPVPGVTQAGILNRETGKLESLPLEELERMVPGYDLVLLEGDGSKMLPLKGWADCEPVVPAFTTVTAGIIPLRPLGKPVSEDLVHRLPLFCAIAGAKPGETLRVAHLAAVIGAQSPARGLFSEAVGEKVLFFNQVEDEAALDQARRVAAVLPPAFRRGLRGIIAGSAMLDKLYGFPAVLD